jgi:hypothetical protein
LSDSIAATPVSLVAPHALVSDLLAKGSRSGPPRQRIDRNAATANPYPSSSPAPRRIPAIPAGAIPVTNCDDNGPGSLRDAVATAVSGQTIDLTATGCSTITLTTGDLSIGQQDLILQGPGASELAIDGNNLYSLRHYNAFGGALQVDDLTITHGRRYLLVTDNLSPRGGCIYSYGTVALANAQVTDCTVGTANPDPHFFTLGGGVYAKAGLVVDNSSITLSSAGTPDLYGYGGAAFTRGPATITHSNLDDNYASGAGGAFMGTGGVFMSYSSILRNTAYTDGGLYVSGGVTTISNSTIALNSATDFGGAFIQGSSGFPAMLINSTISGNTASHLVGGLALTRYPAKIANSTIAFNTESNAANATYGAGLFIGTDVEIESSIIARNTLDHSVYGAVGDDIGGFGAVTGANNLTQVVLTGIALPADTIYADPLLLSLQYNGGLTATHALSAASLAIDAGNDLAGVDTDQRGTGFARMIGANVDIGAFELDVDDVLFADGFD